MQKATLFSLFLFISCLLANATTHVVSSNADSGSGSLREAVTNASSGDTITFSLSYPDTIFLSTQISISKDLVIEGPGADDLVLDGGSATRILNVSSGSVVKISGLHFYNGRGMRGEPSTANRILYFLPIVLFPTPTGPAMGAES